MKVWVCYIMYYYTVVHLEEDEYLFTTFPLTLLQLTLQLLGILPPTPVARNERNESLIAKLTSH